MSRTQIWPWNLQLQDFTIHRSPDIRTKPAHHIACLLNDASPLSPTPSTHIFHPSSIQNLYIIQFVLVGTIWIQQWETKNDPILPSPEEAYPAGLIVFIEVILLHAIFVQRFGNGTAHVQHFHFHELTLTAIQESALPAGCCSCRASQTACDSTILGVLSQGM